jgi:hypothetical protein
MGPPAELVLALRQQMAAEDFIETGTYRGDTAAWAAEHFARVATIELSPQHHAVAAERFRPQPQVRVLHGNSASVLRQIIPTLTRPAIFWLDAHWSGLDTAGREAECPLLDEIALLNSAACVHAVLVDDARLFCAPPPRPHRAEQWPDLASTVGALAHDRRRYVTLFEDVFIAVPNDLREFLSAWLQTQTTAAWANAGRKRWWQKLRG